MLDVLNTTLREKSSMSLKLYVIYESKDRPIFFVYLLSPLLNIFWLLDTIFFFFTVGK